MAQPYAGVATLSSAGVSAAIGLDPTARVTSILLGLTGLNTSSAGACDITVQGTFDTWLGAAPSAGQVWNNISTTHYSSVSGATLLTFTGPLAGLRLASSAFTSVSSGAVAPMATLKALQSITAGP